MKPQENAMPKGFVVTDADGNISWRTDKSGDGGPESFATYAAADKRAKELAECSPGTSIGIYQIVAETTAAVSKPETKRYRT